MKGRKWRVAMYSPGMVGLGHIRRQASIAHALSCSALQPVIVLIAEARQAGALPLPKGVDCVTLPALRKEGDGWVAPRHLDLSNQDLIRLRAKVISRTIKYFEPDVLIVDHLPLGAAGELTRALERVRKRGNTRCVLGLRDVLRDPETVQRTWSAPAQIDAARDFYDAVWIYCDPVVYDMEREYGIFDQAGDKPYYTGYLDQRPRLEFARAQSAELLASLPRGRLAVCVVGGGHDGARLAEAFAEAELPPKTSGVVVTGPYMPAKTRLCLHRFAQTRPGLKLLEFVPEPAALINRADRVIAMGGYNTMCEVLSFEKHALIVPRVKPKPEQWIRAQRMKHLGLVHVLHPDKLSPRAISEWLACDLGPTPPSRSRVDFGGLIRIPTLLADLLKVGEAATEAVAVPVSEVLRGG